MSDDDKKITPITNGVNPDDVVAVVGGLVDESKVTLVLYGEQLDPQLVTEALGVMPTSKHRKGDRPGHRSPPYKKGAWLLEEVGEPPVGPEELIGRLLARLPDSGSPVWTELSRRFEIQLWFGLFMSGWNRGFGISREQIDQLGKIGCRLEFDIYVNDDDET